MTLPFRRRHHDDEAGHDRARSLLSSELLEPLGEDESAWLVRHLETCAECSRDREAYAADRELLRGLRDHAPEPPRDLWANTAAALDREAGRRSRATTPASARRGRPSWRGLPLSAAAGALIVLVVVGTRIFTDVTPPSGTPGPSRAAVDSPIVRPTPIALPGAGQVGWLASTPDGKWELFISDVGEVCPRSEPDCGPDRLDSGPARSVNLGGKPSTVTISADLGQLVFESDETSGAGRILVVPISDPTPVKTPGPTTGPAATEPPSTEPTTQPSATQTGVEPTPEPTPTGQLEIATGVTIVGDVAYSQDGKWLAFSAEPIDGSTGPDLYLWSVGTPHAIAVTTDHRTYFATWHDNRVLASTVLVANEPAATGDPGASDAPASEAPGSEAPVSEAPPSNAPPAPIEARPASFLLDPATLTRTDLSEPDVWLPVVDGNGRFVTYWSGTVRSVDGRAWELGSGRLLLDRWSTAVSAPAESADPAATADAAATADPAATLDPAAAAGPAFGPQGAGVEIVDGTTGSFKVRFDPTGTRLAVWVAELPTDPIGRLSLLVLDPETGAIASKVTPLVSVPALGRFSIDESRLAWVSPDGQDGEQSAVKVLGWSNDEFGEIQTRPAGDLYIVR